MSSATPYKPCCSAESSSCRCGHPQIQLIRADWGKANSCECACPIAVFRVNPCFGKTSGDLKILASDACSCVKKSITEVYVDNDGFFCTHIPIHTSTLFVRLQLKPRGEHKSSPVKLTGLFCASPECESDALTVLVTPPWDPAGTCSNAEDPTFFKLQLLDSANNNPLANQDFEYTLSLIFDNTSQCSVFSSGTATTNGAGCFGSINGPELNIPCTVGRKAVLGYYLTVRAIVENRGKKGKCKCLEGCNAACTMDGPPPPGAGTAWGFIDGNSQCFNTIQGGCTNKWGWCLGSTTPFQIMVNAMATADLYAGAAQCDLSKGTLVGSVTAKLVAIDNNELTFEYEYQVNAPFNLLEAQIDFWSGCIPPRRTNGEPNCNWAPGQFACASVIPGGMTISGTCKREFDTLNNGWYFFPHAVVGGV